MKQITLNRNTQVAALPARRCTASLLVTWLVYGWAMAALWYAAPHTLWANVGLWSLAIALGAGLAKTTLEGR